jgi:hypothetical protein
MKEIITALSPGKGQSELEAFEAAQWSTALMGEPAFRGEPATGIQRGETGEAIGHREVISW